MRVKLTSSRAIYIHNDLKNTAFHFKKRIVERMGNNDREGIFLEMTAALTMTAFALEACVNFVGDRVLGDRWRERASYWQKVKLVFEELGIQADYECRPFSSIGKLKKLRDTLAHGKPEHIEEEEIVIGTYDELCARQRLAGGWEEMVTLDNVVECYDDMNEIWRLMLEAAKIEVIDTTTQGGHGMELIEFIDD
ncbi:hypothetical protein HPQ64_10320 [Rhizobiales bacterium]|uniref:hypothetical protein n=1 Tax=Hongsoonwoonella zoysiae TaxID=2821844 RepID=UPI00155FE56F|nr:hypothetical protein [Hongsoonwoonella zoysiae]NRG18084.1 hypothetical protein [Hongsoonwoonella zoysiae]